MDVYNLDVPKSIQIETENYKNQNDIIGQWLNEYIIECKNDTTSFKDLYNSPYILRSNFEFCNMLKNLDWNIEIIK